MKPCKCTTDSALCDDFGVVKCQYCGGAVKEDRARKFAEYNLGVKIKRLTNGVIVYEYPKKHD